jgi:hypothetical protein
LAVAVVAWAVENPHPWRPIGQASEDFARKISKDLSRLIVFGVTLGQVLINVVSSIFKMAAYLGVMAVGRVAGLLGKNIAHDAHTFFAYCHVKLNAIAEFFYPARALKFNVVADPKFTASQECVRLKLLEKQGANKRQAPVHVAEQSTLQDQKRRSLESALTMYPVPSRLPPADQRLIDEMFSNRLARAHAK